MNKAEVEKVEEGYAVKQILVDTKKPTILGVYETRKLAEEYAAIVNG